MDPSSALGLAANVLQFVQFAFGLLTNAQRIHLSGPGPSGEEQSVEGIYARLLDFSTLFEGMPQSQNEDAVVFQSSKYFFALAKLVEECRGHCEKLLGITRKLQVKDGTKARWLKSFEKALYETWKKEDIESLKSRIRDCQTEIVVHLCHISR
jgi:hypothetical protein